jgi:hypothetical protein
MARKLSAHASCVNALAFSNLDGRWLASGGDGVWHDSMDVDAKLTMTSDRQTYLPVGLPSDRFVQAHTRAEWSTSEMTDLVRTFIKVDEKLESNVFTTAFSASNKYLFACVPRIYPSETQL